MSVAAYEHSGSLIGGGQKERCSGWHLDTGSDYTDICSVWKFSQLCSKKLYTFISVCYVSTKSCKFKNASMMVICNHVLFASQFYKYKISNGLCKSIHVASLLTFCNQTCKWPLNGPRLLDLSLFFKRLLEGKMPSKLLFTFFRDQNQPLLKVFLFQNYLKCDFP